MNRPLSPRALHGRQKLSLDSRGRTIRPIRIRRSKSDAQSPKRKQVGDLLEQELKNEEIIDQNRLLFSNEDSDDEEASLEYANSRKNSPQRQRFRVENNYHMRNRLSRIHRSIRKIRKKSKNISAETGLVVLQFNRYPGMESSKPFQPRDDGNLILQIRRRDNSVSQIDGCSQLQL